MPIAMQHATLSAIVQLATQQRCNRSRKTPMQYRSHPQHAMHVVMQSPSSPQTSLAVPACEVSPVSSVNCQTLSVHVQADLGLCNSYRTTVSGIQVYERNLMLGDVVDELSERFLG